MKTYLKQR